MQFSCDRVRLEMRDGLFGPNVSHLSLLMNLLNFVLDTTALIVLLSNANLSNKVFVSAFSETS